MNEVSRLRTETSKTYELDPKLGQGQYALEARTGPIHYKETYADHEPWQDLDETYSEPGEIKGIGKVLIYPRLPNIVTVFQDLCGYRIQSRSNPGHMATVELVSIDGQEVRTWQKTAALNMYPKIHPFRVGIWKDLSGASRSKSVTMRWKITEQGSADRDSHPFFFRENPEAFSTASLDQLSLEAMERARVTVECSRTRIDDKSWHWDEIIPANARLVDTDWQVGNTADDAMYDDAGSFSVNYRPALGYTSGQLYIHMFHRFASVGIANGSTINSAYITLTNRNNQSGTLQARVYGNNVDNATAPTTNAEALSLSATTNYASWTVPNQTLNSTATTPSIVSSVQEIVSRSGFASGNALLIFVKSVSGTTLGVFREYYDYYESTSKAAKLTVTWTENRRGPKVFIPNVSWLSKSLLKRREI